MKFVPVILFLLAALLGMFLLSYVLKGRDTPKSVAFVHGSLAFLGIISLIYLAFYSTYQVWASLIIFILAALGGFYLIFRDLTGKQVPKLIAIIHGLVALSAFAILVMTLFSIQT